MPDILQFPTILKSMFKKTISSFIVKSINRVYRKLHSMGAFFLPLSEKMKNIDTASVRLGEKCIIDPSAILITTGNGCITFYGDNYVGRCVEMGGAQNITLGFGTSIQDRCVILGDVEIGNFCTFSLNVYVSSGRHYYNFKPELYIRDQDAMVLSDPELQKEHSKKVLIEDDCFLGINSVVMQGVKIGKGSVIGANSVVTKDVEPYSVMAGTPAVLVKKRLKFELKDSIDFLCDSDLPYFYSGFLTNSANIKEGRIAGGIGALKEFAVYLNGIGKNKIALQIKKTGRSSLNIEYNNQTKVFLSNEIEEIEFNIAKVNLHVFSITSVEEPHFLFSKSEVLVQSVKTF